MVSMDDDGTADPTTEAPHARSSTSLFSHPDAKSAELTGRNSDGTGLSSDGTQDEGAGPGDGAPPVSAKSAGSSAFGLLFQAPDLTEIPARPRRRSAPVETPDEPADTDRDAAKASVRADRDADGASTKADDGAGDEDSGDEDSGDEDSGGRRRRRRGGKGRRGRGGAGDDGGDQDGRDQGSRSGRGQDSDDGVDSDESDQGGQGGEPGEAGVTAKESSRSGASRKQGKRGQDQPAQDGAEETEDGESGSKRRRRRRRSGEESERSERSERSAKDEVSGVKGSTRLEAKRQRRKEGREAGRRRTIITEAEFLARRESVERTMVVRGLEDRTQIGVLEDGVLVEHYVSRDTQTTMLGNVYLGRVQNVLPSMEAAFVDIGKGRNAVLYAGEVNWDAAGLDNAPKRIENALKSGESVLVQVTKDPIGHKGARLTSQISLPGRYLVYVPNNSMTGISRKLPDTERARLKQILKEVVPSDAGVIVRTAAEGASEAELRADVERLTSMWERIQSKQGSVNAPALVHGEPDLTVRVIRDVFNEDFTRLIASGGKAWGEISDYVGSVAPDLADRVEKWSGTDDVFTHFRVTEALAKAMDRKVWLPSGGSLVIDRTEAMTVVDVNTGKFVGSGGNLEETVTKNNIEAAEEIVRQLRLRDIGGIIVVDFIDMVLESNRDLVVRRLLECLGRDRTKHQVAEVTSLGLVQMTRKRVGAGLIEVFSETCPHCSGRGILVHSEPVEKSSGSDDGGGNGAGAARGGRGGRKARSGSAGGGSAGNGAGKEVRNVLPTPNPNGPTPAQIAAAAHGAALQAGSVAEAADAAAKAAAQEVTPDRAGRPEVSGAGAAEGSAQDAAGPGPQEQPEQEPSVAPAPAAEADLPAPSTPRPRRKRGRVVAPAGPPTGSPEHGVD